MPWSQDSIRDIGSRHMSVAGVWVHTCQLAGMKIEVGINAMDLLLGWQPRDRELHNWQDHE